METDNQSLLVVDNVCDVEDTEKPFGKRYGQREIILTPEHLAALNSGKVIAIDVSGEYVVFLSFEKKIRVEKK